MSKVVLVNPPLENKARLYKELAEVRIIYPPLGLLYLAGALAAAGHEVKIIDLEILDENPRRSARKILSLKPDYVGVTATTIAIGNAAELAGEMRKLNVKLPIILGGVHVTAVPERTLEKFPQFSLGVVGEGEETLIELIGAMEGGKNLEKVPGLALRAGRKIKLTTFRELNHDLDSLTFPAFDLLPNIKAYGGSQFIDFDTRPTFRLVTSRGCPFNCRFCARTVFGNRWRSHSPEYVLEMVKRLYNDFNIRHIYFSDDTFTVDKARVRRICKLLISENLDLTWDCNSRVDTVDLPLLETMKRAGCTYIAYGIESGNEEILRILNKGITLAQVRQTLEWTKKTGIKVRGNFMIANPGETIATMQETINVAKSLPIDTFKMSFFTPFPGTEFYNQIQKYGDYKEDWDKLSKYSPVFIPKGLNLPIIERYYKRAYMNFYFRPGIVWSYLVNIRSLKQLETALRNFITLSSFIFSKLLHYLYMPFNKYQRLKSVFTMGVTLLILLLLVFKIRWGGFIGAIKMVDGKILVLAFVISIGHNILGVTDKWRWILKRLGYPLPYGSLLFGRVGSYAMRGVLPLKSGEFSRVAYVKRFHGVPVVTGTKSVVIGIVLNVVALVIIMAVGIFLRTIFLNL